MPALPADISLQQRNYLLRIANAINARLDLSEVLELVTRFAVEITSGRAGLIAMRQPGGELRIAASFQLEEKYVAHLQPLLEQMPLAIGEADQDETNEQKKVAIEEQLQRLSRDLPEPFAQLLALPLVSSGETIGVLLVFRSEGATLFTPLDSELVGAFASHAAVAIRNAHLYAVVLQHANEFRRLYDFSVAMVSAPDASRAIALAVEYALTIGPSEMALFVPVHEGDVIGLPVARNALGKELESALLASVQRASTEQLPLSEPRLWPGQGSDQRPPALFDEFEMSAVAAIPVRSADRLRGILWVAMRQQERYGTEHIRLLLACVQYVGLALDKFDLIDQLRAQERQLSTVVTHNPAGLLLLDRHGQVLLHNEEVWRLVGAAEPLSTSVHDVLQLQDDSGNPLALSLPEDGSWTTRGYIRRRDGTRGPFMQFSVTALLSETGSADNSTSPEGYVVNLVDLTALKEAETAKNVFLAGLSHELKTPLSIIQGYAETLRYPQVQGDAELFDESLGVILDETAHLTEMVNQLLLAARLQAGVLALDYDDVAVIPFISKIVETLRQRYPERQWELAAGDELPSIEADPTRLREVFYNLLTNAVNYSETGSLIRVEAEATAAGIRVAIRDEGIGISPEEQKRLFQRFFRASDRADGTGLGLYMSRAIVEAHGGSIHVESSGIPGRGSVFTVYLPRVRPAERATLLQGTSLT